MRALLSFAILMTSGCALFGRNQEIERASSPDRRFTVRAVESANPLRICYEIVSAMTGKPVHRIPGSYQPDSGADDWDWNLSKQAKIFWSSDSRFVVVDEQVYRFAGYVQIVEMGDLARTIDLPEIPIPQPGKNWERWRIRVDKGWVSKNELSLVVAGTVPAEKLDDGRQTSQRVEKHFLVAIRKGAAVIVRVSDPEDA